MHSFSETELQSSLVQELPDRQMMGAVFWVSGSIQVDLFEGLLNHTFHNWSISVLDDNHIQVTVQDDLTGSQVALFCDETATAFAAQCTGQLI